MIAVALGLSTGVAEAQRTGRAARPNKVVRIEASRPTVDRSLAGRFLGGNGEGVARTRIRATPSPTRYRSVPVETSAGRFFVSPWAAKKIQKLGGQHAAGPTQLRRLF